LRCLKIPPLQSFLTVALEPHVSFGIPLAIEKHPISQYKQVILV